MMTEPLATNRVAAGRFRGRNIEVIDQYRPNCSILKESQAMKEAQAGFDQIATVAHRVISASNVASSIPQSADRLRK